MKQYPIIFKKSRKIEKFQNKTEQKSKMRKKKEIQESLSGQKLKEFQKYYGGPGAPKMDFLSNNIFVLMFNGFYLFLY